MSKLWRSSLLFALVCALALPAAAQVEHPDLKSKKKVVRAVLVLPPQVTVGKIGMKGGEGMIEEAQRVELALAPYIAKALESKGCKLLPSPFTTEALQQNAELKYTLTDIQSRYDALLPQIQKKSKDVRKGRFTMGDEVSKLNPEGAADALVFVRGSGMLSTGGKKAFALLIGGPGLVEYIQLVLTVVDARDGAVLYHANAIATGNFVKDPGHMEKPVQKSFKKFIGPPATVAAKSPAS